MAGQTGLPSLTSLDLSWNLLGDEGAHAIAKGTGLQKLVALRLRANDIRDEGARAIVSSAALPSLTSLDLANNRVFRVGALTDLTQGRILRKLDLSDNDPFRQRRQLRP